MSLESDLTGRSGGVCELCVMKNARTACDVPLEADDSAEMAVLLCRTCLKGINGVISDSLHWLCLSEAVWSTYALVQLTAYRLLRRLSEQHWARDILEILYFEPAVLTWAKKSPAANAPEINHRDSHGVLLAAGDTVTLIKDLPFKGG